MTANLGEATNGQLVQELAVRFEMGSTHRHYSTVTGEASSLLRLSRLQEENVKLHLRIDELVTRVKEFEDREDHIRRLVS